MGVIHNKEAIEALKKTAASLQEQINNIDPGGGPTVTVTDITADITTDPEIIMTGVTCTLAVLEKYGAIVHFHAEFTSDAGNTGVDGVVYTMSEELQPRFFTGAIAANSDESAPSVIVENGGIYTEYQFSGPGIVYTDLYWIANPAPAPEPGE